MKLTKLRERSRALQQTSANPTYKKRYSIIAEPKGYSEPKVGDRSSRRQTRLFDWDKKKSVDSVMSSSRDEPAWVNPKALLAARSQGMTEDEARENLQEQERRDEKYDKAQMTMHRTSLAPRSKIAAVKRDSMAKTKRPMSTAYSGRNGPDFTAWKKSGVRNFDEPTEDNRPRRAPRAPPVSNWAQLEESDEDDAAAGAGQHESLRQKIYKRRTLFVSKPDIQEISPMKPAEPSATAEVPVASASSATTPKIPQDAGKEERINRSSRFRDGMRGLFRKRRE